MLRPILPWPTVYRKMGWIMINFLNQKEHSDKEIVVKENMTEYFCLYKFFDEKMNLLYVGMTNNFGKRLSQHASSKWFDKIEVIKKEFYSSRMECESAETESIKTEKPIYNIRKKNNEKKREGCSSTPKRAERANGPGAKFRENIVR